MQLGQTLVLITALRVLFDDGSDGLGLSAVTGWLIDLLMILVLLYILLRIPSWTYRQVFAASSFGHHRSLFGSAARTVVLGAAFGAIGARTAAVTRHARPADLERSPTSIPAAYTHTAATAA